MRRLDIQGLRAISALLVAVFHIFQWGVSGGVDVFLVVSGFFLWPKVLRITESGSGFLEHGFGFLRKTAPQAILVVLCTLVAAFFLISPVEWSAIIKDAAFSVTFLQNYWLAITGQDYLAREEGLSLFQHYWAVSVIAQTYFFFPVMAALAIFASWLCGWRRRKTLLAILVLVVFGSFAWSLIFAASNPEVAYFDTVSRLWQFGAGAFAASVLRNRNTVKSWEGRISGPLSWVGLLAILSCGALWGRSFPGLISLWPTIGALLVLLYSYDAAGLKNAGSILSQKRLASLGTISFGFYLWHWPIYAIWFRYSADQTIISAIVIIIIGLVLTLLGDSTIKAIQRLFERSRLRLGMAALSAFCIPLIAASALLVDREIWSEKSVFHKIEHPIWGIPLSWTSARGDLPTSYRLGCHQSQIVSTVETCSFGNLSSETTVALVGGSHAAQWLPAFQDIASWTDIHLLTMTKSACTFFDPDLSEASEYGTESCRDWNRNVIEYLKGARPDVLVALVNSRGDEDIAGIQSVLSNFVRRGTTVVGIRDTPDMKVDVVVCATGVPLFGSADCRIPRKQLIDDKKYMDTVSKLPQGVMSIDMNDVICPDAYCMVRDGEILMWRDSHHLTASYVHTLSATLLNRIAPALEPLVSLNLLLRDIPPENASASDKHTEIKSGR